MPETVRVRGVEYLVGRFTNSHLQTISKMLVVDSSGHFDFGSFSVQSECAEVVLEVIIPTLPREAISVSPRGKYVWQLDQLEISVLLMQIVKIWRSRQIEVAKARKDKESVKLHEQHLQAIDGYLAEFTPLLEDLLPAQDLEQVESDQSPPEVEALKFEPEAQRIERLEQELAQLRSAVAQEPSQEPSLEPAANE